MLAAGEHWCTPPGERLETDCLKQLSSAADLEIVFSFQGIPFLFAMNMSRRVNSDMRIREHAFTAFACVCLCEKMKGLSRRLRERERERKKTSP